MQKVGWQGENIVGKRQMKPFWKCYVNSYSKLQPQTNGARPAMFINKGSGFNPFKISDEEKESLENNATKEFFSELISGQKLTRRKAAAADLKRTYKKVLEASFTITLAATICLFQAARLFSLDVAALKKVDVTIEVADIPLTQQFRKPPPPLRPSIPVPTEDESVPEDLTISLTDLDLSDIPPPPAPPEEDDLIFVAYDKAPEIIGGFAALHRHLKYPQLAARADLEGKVFVKVLVGVDGRTQKTEIITAKPRNAGFEESAMEALRKVKWKPALQRDKKVRVWISFPVTFKLLRS